MAYIKFYEKKIKSRRSLKECVEFNLADEDLCKENGRKMLYQYYLDKNGKLVHNSLYKKIWGGQCIWNKEKTEEYAYIIISWDKNEIWPEEAMDICKWIHEEYLDEFPTLIAIHEDQYSVHAHMIIRKRDYYGECINTSCKELLDFGDDLYGHNVVYADEEEIPYETRLYFDVMKYLMY